MKWTIEHEGELEQVVKYVCEHVLTEKSVGAKTLGLYGNLGAGKTTFTKKLVKALGGKDSVTSPTFILERDYAVVNDTGITTLAHIDAYRFEEEGEASVLRMNDRLGDVGILYVVEWPEKMGKYMPAHTKLFFEHTGDDARTITFESII